MTRVNVPVKGRVRVGESRVRIREGLRLIVEYQKAKPNATLRIKRNPLDVLSRIL